MECTLSDSGEGVSACTVTFARLGLQPASPTSPGSVTRRPMMSSVTLFHRHIEGGVAVRQRDMEGFTMRTQATDLEAVQGELLRLTYFR